MAQKLTAWSYSRYSEWKACPFKAKLKFIDKLPEPENPAMKKGNEYHKILADYMSSKTDIIPKILPECFHAEMSYFRTLKPLVEQQWAFDSNWNVVDWFAYNTWARIIADVAVMDVSSGVLNILDWKTGKVYDAHLDQLSLYAVGAFARFPTMDKIRVRLMYVDQKFELPEVPKIYVRGSDEHLNNIKLWNNNVRPMLLDELFPPRPNQYCRSCHFRQNNGGPCTY